MKNTQNDYTLENAISPLDGRNRYKLKNLSLYFSESALLQNRMEIEIKYLFFLSKYGLVRKLSLKEEKKLGNLINENAANRYKEVREIEKKTNHDMKAVEEYLKIKLQKTSMNDIFEMVHFGLTSEDINNLAYAKMIDGCIKKEIKPLLNEILGKFKKDILKYSLFSMLGRTHGQSAAPTTLGKELLVYRNRLNDELQILEKIKLHGKLNGNTGGLNVHQFLFPQKDWIDLSKKFVTSLGFISDLATTQIEHYDSYIRTFQTLSRINNIFLDLSVNMWIYIMQGYFKQKVISKEVGSTALPHKVNPIYFEGAEGGFEIANALFDMYARKLSKSRLQRDLSDSTVRRSFGIAFGYSILSYQSILEGMNRVEGDREIIINDLNNHYEILSEPVQNMLRMRGIKKGYDMTKEFFRGKHITEKSYIDFIQELALSKKDKLLLLKLKPELYVGVSNQLTTHYV